MADAMRDTVRGQIESRKFITCYCSSIGITNSVANEMGMAVYLIVCC